MARTHHHGERSKRKLYGDNWFWMRSEPKAWRKQYKHKPRRAAVRQCVNLIFKGEEDIIWPLDKKPWIYYW